jgi:hypothetical protein
MDRRQGGPQGRSEHCGEEKILLLPGFEPGRVLIGIVWDGVQFGLLGTTATDRPIVPAADDDDDGEIGGMMIGRGNRSTRRKPASVPLFPPQTPHALARREPGPPLWEASE